MSNINTSSVTLKICKAPRGPIKGTVVVDLFCREGFHPIAVYLTAIGYDYKAPGHGRAFKVYGGGATLFHSTMASSTIAGRPFVRQEGERVGVWLDRCSSTASGIGIELPITAVTPHQLEDLLQLVAISEKFDYERETRSWIAWHRAQKPTDHAIGSIAVPVEVVEPTVSVPTDHPIEPIYSDADADTSDLTDMSVKELRELWKSKAPKSWGSFPRSARRPIEVLLETLL